VQEPAGAMGFDDSGEQGKSGPSGGAGNGGAAPQITVGAPPPELHSGQDMLAWKREYNIRQREADWKRRQEENLTQKQVAWQIEGCERENRLQSSREARKREELEKRVYRKHLDVDRKYKERCRNVEIERRGQAWEDKENTRLVAMHKEAKQASEERDAGLSANKAKHCQDLRQAASDRAERRRRQEEIDAKREANIKRKEAERQAKAAEGAQKLKEDAIAKSNMIVANFTDRAVTTSPMLVSVLAQR